MIRKTHGRADSPARAAHRKKSPATAKSAASVAKKRVAMKRSATSRRG
jgi:hypothetical protein